jgi:hypothetical protein
MYSVVRFSNCTDAEALRRVGDLVNQELPGAFAGLDSIGHRFSCSASVASDTVDHLAQVLVILNRLSTAIDSAREMGCNVILDLAIEPPDYENRLLTPVIMKGDLIATLAAHGMEFVLSLYGTGKAGEIKGDRRD